MSRPTFIQIDLDAIRHNAGVVRQLASHSSIMAMVKANAYGHGLVNVAQALPTVEAMGVACLEEGLALRAAGVKQPIVLMEGLFSADEVALAMEHHFTLVVHHALQIEWLEKYRGSQALSIWIKINTGMYRLGFEPTDLPQAVARLAKLSCVQQPMGYMTHFANAAQLQDSMTQDQIKIFSHLTSAYAGPKSLANSAGLLCWPNAQHDWVRPGLLLYGASPLDNKTGLDLQLQPVMTFRSEIMATHVVKKGERIGYGLDWCAPEQTTIGIVPVGYGDGYPQFAPAGTPVLVNGKLCSIAGRVSMDMLSVNLNSCPQVKVGDPVVMWGEGLPVELVARSCGTTAYELLTRMTPRPKVVTRESEQSKIAETSIINK